VGLKQVRRLTFATLLFATALVVIPACTRGSNDLVGEDDGTSGIVITDVDVLEPDEYETEVAGLKPCDVLSDGENVQTLESGGRNRAYLVHIPSRSSMLRNASLPLPVVLNLHGFGSNARNQAAYSRLPEKAEEEGFVLVTPDGAGTPQQWNNLQLPALPDDVAFISDLLDHLEDTLCIDPERIYAAGISNGSAFAQRLACLLPDRIAAVAAVAAFVYPIVCDGRPPVPIIAFHGTADACVPYEGGVTTCGRGNLPVPPVETSAENWARHNGCATGPVSRQVSEHVREIAYSGCTDSADVVLYAVEGGGHTWPGSINVPRLGPVTREIDATQLMVEFFKSH
jgi:polyhydroxybutyrate depolymerase